MSLTSYQVATVWGIPIRLHLSLLILLFYFTTRLGSLNGLLFGIGFLISIILHELGHSIVALRKGCRVRQITLMVVGGAAQMDRIPERPWDEFAVAIAGPIVSLALGLILIPLGHLLPLPLDLPAQTNLIEYIGYANIVLLIFNLIPAFPMDGGRILRAILSSRFSRLRATAAAARIGQLFAIAGGLYGLTRTPTDFLLMLVSYFIFSAAGQEYKLVQMQDRMRRGQPPPFPFPFFTATPPPDDPVEDRVVISPPPYERGPAVESDVRPGRQPPPSP